MVPKHHSMFIRRVRDKLPQKSGPYKDTVEYDRVLNQQSISGKIVSFSFFFQIRSHKIYNFQDFRFQN